MFSKDRCGILSFILIIDDFNLFLGLDNLFFLNWRD